MSLVLMRAEYSAAAFSGLCFWLFSWRQDRLFCFGLVWFWFFETGFLWFLCVALAVLELTL
jgi:hypothetical protein